MEYKNHYLGLDKSQKLRTTFEVDLRDVAFLRSFDPKLGNVQITASILFKKLINELKSCQHVRPGEFSEYQHAIGELRIVLGAERVPVTVAPTGSKSASPVKTPRGNVRRGVKSVAQPATGPQELPNHASAPGSGRDDISGKVGESK